MNRSKVAGLRVAVACVALTFLFASPARAQYFQLTPQQTPLVVPAGCNSGAWQGATGSAKATALL